MEEWEVGRFGEGVKQVNISRFEKGSDVLISTHRNYLESHGCELEINIRMSKTGVARVKELNTGKRAAARKYADNGLLAVY